MCRGDAGCCALATLGIPKDQRQPAAPRADRRPRRVMVLRRWLSARITESRIVGIVFTHSSRGRSSQLLQQRLGLSQVARVEAFGEPVVDWGKEGVCFAPFALTLP